MAEPVSLDLAKKHLNVLDTDNDDLITGYIVAAREWVENFTSRLLVRRSITEHRRQFAALELRYRPVVAGSVTVSYRDDGIEAQPVTSFTASAREPVRIYSSIGSRWPTISRNGEVELTYTAGYADGEVPPSMIQAMLLLIAEFYESREAGSLSPDTERAVAGLLRFFRRRTL